MHLETYVQWVLDDFWNEEDFIDTSHYDGRYPNDTSDVDYDYVYDYYAYASPYENMVAESRHYLNRLRKLEIQKATRKCGYCGMHNGCNSTRKSHHSDVRKLHKSWKRN